VTTPATQSGLPLRLAIGAALAAMLVSVGASLHNGPVLSVLASDSAAPPCSAVTAQVEPTSSGAGDSLKVAASGVCPTGSAPLFSYFVGPSESGPWTLEAAWVGASWTWTPSAGTSEMQDAIVWVSDGPYTVPQAQTEVALQSSTPLDPCSAVAAQVGVALGGASSSLTVTASGSCPAGSAPLYTYFVGPSITGPWTLRAAWIGASWTWTAPAGTSATQYAIVWVSDGPYTVPQAQTEVALQPPCSAVSAEVGAASGGATGSLTAIASGSCPAGSAPLYSYFVGPSSSGPWTLTAAWIGPSWTWNPPAGTSVTEYAIVWVSDGPYTVPQAQTEVALQPPCSAVSAEVGAASGGATGSLTLTASGSCPAGSAPLYTYFVGPSSSGPWTLTAAWVGPSWTWTPSAGTSEMQDAIVWVSDGPYTVPQAQTEVALEAVPPAACSGVSVTLSPAGSTQAGSAVTVDASSTCPAGSVVKYSYFVGSGSGPWTLEAAWIGPSWTWNTVGEPAGSYSVLAWASDGPYTVPQVQSMSAITLTVNPLSNPPANITPNFESTCYEDGYQSLTCEEAEVADIDSALSSEGVGPLVWPTLLYSLPLAQQQFVVTNEERVLRGLTPIAGMDSAADQNALTGSQVGEDPPIQLVSGEIAAFGDWAEDYGALGSDFDWMYNDGPGSFNIDCPSGSTSSACWDHRDAILTNTVSGTFAPPSGYSWVAGDACTANAGTTFLSNCDLEFVLIPTSSVTYDFTWTQALADGA
jgi:hypothetical protein